MKKSKLWIATICFIVAGVVLIGVAALVGGRDIFTKYPIFAVPFRTTLVTDVNEQSELIEEPFDRSR